MISRPGRQRRAAVSGMAPLRLSALKPFAAGMKRQCYVHPQNPGLCIKVAKSVVGERRGRRDQRRDVEGQAWLRRHRPDSVFDRIPVIKDVVATDLGSGLIMRLYRDVDGSISRSAATLIRESGLTPALGAAIDDWKHWVLEQRVLTQDTGPHNILAQDLGGQRYKMVLIEGWWVKRRYRWLAWFHPRLCSGLIRRELRRFDRRLGDLLD